MKILIIGADGYLGWPTAMYFSNQGHDVCVIDNYLKRKIALETNSEPLNPISNLHDRSSFFLQSTKREIRVEIGDCNNFKFLSKIFENFNPDCVVHYAEQPSAPYSMMNYDSSKLTLQNNLGVTFNVIWCVKEFCPNCHIIKLGTMGEYGTPNIDIEEGWIDVEHNGRKQKFLYPRQASSLYHTSKVLDTDLLWFYVRTYNLKVTDLMQGPVYGFKTKETLINKSLQTAFHYDDIFGTVLNRFIVQAISDIPLTVYGEGGQTRGYLNIVDTLQCVDLAIKNDIRPGEMRILNQFTEQFTVNELAQKIKEAGENIGIKVTIKKINNPRKELEKHYYNPKYSGFKKLGLKPNLLTNDVIVEMLEYAKEHKSNINFDILLPRVKW